MPAFTLSDVGEHYLAGLLEHARAMAVFCTPTINGFGRFRPNALAPQAVLWGRDNRGAMLRVLGRCGDAATRIENRIGEPSANPYLYIAAQIHAGLDGHAAQPARRRGHRRTLCRRARPAADDARRCAAGAVRAMQALVRAFGAPFVDCLIRTKRAELARYEQAADKDEWQRREYFSRF